MRFSVSTARFGSLAFVVASTLLVVPAPAQEGSGTPASPVQAGGDALLPARSLQDIAVTSSPDGGDRIVLTLDREPRFQVQEVEDPYRVVIDLEGTVNHLSRNVRSVNSDQLQRIRTAQYQTSPAPVARVVLDMKGRPAFQTRTEGSRLVIEVAGTGASEDTQQEDTLRPSLYEKKYVASNNQVEPAPAPASGWATMKEETPAPAPAPAPASGWATMTEETPAPAPAPSMKSEPAAPAPSFPVIQARGTETAPAPAPRKTITPAPGAVASDATPSTTVFEKRTIAGEQFVYTGKKISLNLVDADIKQVFRLFHEISGINFVLDPSVAGRVTIVVDEIPWDQALDLVLKNSGLDKVYEGKVIRIATTAKLAQEAGARKALKEAKEIEVDTVTITRTLSYAKAENIDEIIKTGVLLSPRGKSFYDERTNTIIVTDVPAKIEPIDRLLTSLDGKTPQVMIEARIVETSRRFTREFGINWGFHGQRTDTLGNPLDHKFPHNATVDWDLNLPQNAGVTALGFTFGNMSGSFLLDIALDALETEGKGRVLSSPKIATQNNETAEIEQGVRIPVVNTTATEISVDFVAAALRLKVTPQITAEGTVSLDLEVSNDSPEFLIANVQGTPGIRTQRAQTKVLVTDGGTTVIGGIFTVNEGNAETGIPWFRKIPIFGWLFKSREVSSENRELLVFITPRILKD